MNYGMVSTGGDLKENVIPTPWADEIIADGTTFFNNNNKKRPLINTNNNNGHQGRRVLKSS